MEPGAGGRGHMWDEVVLILETPHMGHPLIEGAREGRITRAWRGETVRRRDGNPLLHQTVCRQIHQGPALAVPGQEERFAALDHGLEVELLDAGPQRIKRGQKALMDTPRQILA